MESVQRHIRRGTIFLAAAAVTIGPVLFTAAPASAQPVNVFGIGTVEIPDGVTLPKGIPGIEAPPGAPGVELQRTAGEAAVAAAKTKIGAGYSSGATGPNSFDCSGLVQWAYEQAGRELPRTSYQQLSAGKPVSLNELKTGDVISYYGGSHTALYAGGDNVIHAATYGVGVELAPMSSMPAGEARRF